MSRGSAALVGDVLRVLVVGDSQSVDAAMDALSSAFESISLVRERTLSSAVARLAHLEIHCVVCPLEPSAEVSTLEHLRAQNGELPIVAVAGIDGETADERAVDAALDAGATDVVAADEPKSLIAARVRNAAERYRLERAADQRSRSILERSDALVWVTDEDGRIAYASSAVDHRMGYTPDELERTPLPQLVHPDDRESVRETLSSAAAAEFGTTERAAVRLGHGDGTWHAYELTCANRLADPLVEGLVWTLSAASRADATDTRTIDRLEEPVFALGPQWELRTANAAADRLFVAGEPEPGTVVWDLLDETVRGTFYERFLEADSTGEPVAFETEYPPLDRRLAVSVYPGEDGVTVRAREAPDDAPAVDRERFDLLESVVDALDDGVLVLDGSTVRFANAELLASADAETLVGRDLDDLFDDDLAETVRERSRSPVVRWMDPVSGSLVAGDDRRSVDVFVTPLPDVDRTLCVVRDGRRSATAALSTVGRAIDAVRGGDSDGEVRRAAVEAALECTDADLAAWYLLEDDVCRPAAVATAASASPVELPAIEREGIDLEERLEARAEAEATGAGDDGGDGRDGRDGDGVVFDRAEVESFLARAGIRAERVLAVPVADHGVLLATSTEPMAFGALERTPLEVVGGAAATVLDGLERESTARTYRHELDRLEAVVDRCRHLRETERALLAGESRAAVERRLCEALVSLEGFETGGAIELAWIGHLVTGAERITPDTWAGQNGEYLDAISVPIEDDDPDHPTAIAAATLEPAVVEDIGRGDADREWRRRALERGFGSVLSVPLVVDDFCYGTLTLYADRPSTFDDETRRLCEHLAAVAGHAIGSLERRRALLSDRSTELEIVLRDGDDPLSTVAHRLDRRLDVQSVVPRSSGGSTVFATVSAIDEASVEDAVESVPVIASARVVGDRADETLLELALDEPSIAAALADHGGVVRSVTPADDRTRLVVDLSSTVDVRSFVRTIERRYASAKLVARRERDRSARPVRAFDVELRDRLSERQLRTLETAYYGGFFEWPRESTGEDVAASLGVSQPTFSRHLRIAQQKLFALLFDERTENGDQ